MPPRIFSIITEKREDFLERCRARLRKNSNFFAPAVRKDIETVATALVTFLEPFEGEPSPLTETGIRIRDTFHRCCSSTSLDSFLDLFKAVVQSMETVMVESTNSHEEIGLMLTSFRRITDTLEKAVVADWASQENSGHVETLKEEFHRLLLEKETYENIYKRTNNIILITNNEGYIVEANPQADAFFTREKILGSFCADIVGISPHSVQDILEAYPPGEVHQITLRHDGKEHPFDLRIFRRKTDHSESGGIVMLFNDIGSYISNQVALEWRVSERTRAQANSEKLRSAIFQSVGEGILLVDHELEIVNANHRAAEIYGIPTQNLIGLDIRILTDEGGWRQLTDIFDKLVEGQRLSAEIAGIYVDGRFFSTSTTVTRIDYDGKKFWTIIVHDNTEQKEMEERLRAEKRQTEEMNVTLKNVLSTIEKDRRAFENRLSARIRTAILPALQKAEREADATMRRSYLNLLGHELTALTSGFHTELDAGLIKLTKTELEVCRLIQTGCSSKEICEAMNLSFETVLTHRKNIRRKLNLRGRKVNLQAFLSDRIVERDRDDGKND